MTKPTTPKLVTRESLAAMLANENPAYVQMVIGRALCRLLERQTQSEQSHNTTDEDNGIGFAGADARSGSLTAKYFMKHKKLEDWQVARWVKIGANGFPRLCKYHKQLNEIATQSSKV